MGRANRTVMRALLLSASPRRVEHALRAILASVLAAVPIAACGPFGGNCGTSTGTYDVTFKVCSSDAGGSPEGGACITTCASACELHQPATINGVGLCQDFDAATLALTPGARVTVHCEAFTSCTGRRLDGLAVPFVEGDDLGAWLARAAWLEASAVQAFRRLALELRAHGAPDELVRAARASARDEARHARLMRALADKHGARVPRVERTSWAVRSLEHIAHENAVEGCVHETYGAAVAMLQGAHAADADVARAMREIAPDELRHAALGWAVHSWAVEQLDESARARVARSRDEAVNALIARAQGSHEDHALASALAQSLWAA
jgi:hypothetical protein